MLSQALKDKAHEALSIIYKTKLTMEESDSIMKDVITYWKDHVNEGFLAYRKSVTNEQTYASLDWMDPFPGTAWFLDHRGTRYLDLLGGYGIYNVGRRHPKVVNAVFTQLKKQALHSQELLDPLRSYCANLLSMICPKDQKRSLRKCFFTNSGTESVEACLKLAFLATGRKRILSTVNAFHGKTLGSLACTSKEKFRGVFNGVLCTTFHIPFNDKKALTDAFESSEMTGDRFACFIVEPIQGEGGIYVATDDYLQHARELCDQYGVVLIFDEVQSGMGRTGKWWACDYAGVCPDLMAIGKSFGGGIMPVGACIGTDAVWEKYVKNPFLLTTTFGGNPLALAASIATINVIIDENIITEAATKGESLLLLLRSLKEKYPNVLKDVRGKGMMIGIEFMTNEMGVMFSKMMFESNILVAGTLANAQTIRIEPPLTITSDEILYAYDICENVIKNISLKNMRSKL
jgi:putrescine aminotransferase